MREIKFRAWDKEEKIMIQPCEPDCYDAYFTHHEYEIMQYTGLKDKNGKEIYEGDIVKRPLPNIPLVIKWSNGMKGWGLSIDNINVNFIWFNDDDYEIIGNIYENPELLKESQ